MKFNNLWGYFKKMSKYYEILGINKVFKPEELNDATIDKIKNVINTDEKKALEICEAYCVLSNEKEKKVYDDAPDTYVFNDSKPFIKKPEKVLTDIKTEIYNVKYHHENAKKKYLGQAIGGLQDVWQWLYLQSYRLFSDSLSVLLYSPLLPSAV